jgi:UDP-GlcNAc:undecaprenyl-phosphate GlcNAc-1-phosphate transferase
MLAVLGLILLSVSFGVSLLLCWIARAVSRRVGFVDRPGERKIHGSPIALGGGIGVFATVSGVVLGGVLLALLCRSDPPTWLPGVLSHHLARIAARAPLVLIVLGGGGVLALLGLLDDLRGLSPWVRLGIEAGVALGVCLADPELRVTAFSTFRGLSVLLTVLWIVGITNSFNLLDNMDGLSGGVGAIAGLMFVIVAVLTDQFFLAAMLLVLVGALIGFLRFNFPPASMFMGDSGALFVGYLLSVLTILFTFYMPGRGWNPVSAMLVPLVVLAVPLYDTASVMVIRLKERRPLLSGDKRHFSHRLVELGMSQRGSVLTIWLVTFGTGLLAPVLYYVEGLPALFIVGNVGVMLFLVGWLEHTGRRSLRENGS